MKSLQTQLKILANKITTSQEKVKTFQTNEVLKSLDKARQDNESVELLVSFIY